MFSRSHDSYLKYAECRQECANIVKRSKRSYEKKIANEVNKSSKSFWRYVNSKRKTKDSIGMLVREDNTEAKTDFDKAETLNCFFSSVFVGPDNEGNDHIDIVQHENRNLLENILLSEEDVLKALNSLNPEKSPGPDYIHPRNLYETKKELVKPL